MERTEMQDIALVFVVVYFLGVGWSYRRGNLKGVFEYD